MMHRVVPVILLILAGGLFAGCELTGTGEEAAPRVGRGATQSLTLLTEASTGQITAAFAAVGIPLAPRYAVGVYKIVYETIDADGAVTRASGALLIPRDAPDRRPLVSYQHGTLTADHEVPSAGGAEQLVGLAFAADGYVAVLPDLLGLGDSPGFHPYIHAATSATAVVDMLRAAQDAAAREDVALNGQLFLLGYSQGGYTAMAAHRALEADYRDEFQVTASAPMAGPYDLSGVMTTTFTSPEPHPAPYYLPYLLLAYNTIYRLYDDPSAFLTPPYDTLVPPLFDRRTTGDAINAVLPDVPVAMLDSAFVAAFTSDPDHPLRRRLRENDVYDWTPEAPMRLYHCAGDDFVPAANAAVALARFHERGATQVERVDPLPAGTHATCAGPSLLLAKQWFDSLVE